MTSVILFVFGAIVGSFLNVVGLRYNSGHSLGGRSSCATCGEKLHWFELVPIFSFIFLRARCRRCLAKISWQYPLIEAWTGLLFATLPYVFLPSFCLYVVITVYDLRHKIIPNALVYLSMIVSLAVATSLHYSLLDWLAGPILFTFFALLWLVTRGRAMGFGDAKLALSLGLLLGTSAFSGVIVAFWIGAAWGLSLVFSGILSPLFGSDKRTIIHKGSRLTMKSEVPFAPFLILGSWAAVLFHLDLLHVSNFFQ